MQVVVVGLIVEELWNVNVKCVKVNAARNIGQGHRINISAISTSRRSTMQGLVVVGLKDIVCRCKMWQSHWSTRYRSRSPNQSTCKVRTLRRSTMHSLVVVGLIVEAISNVNIKCTKVTAALYIGQGQKSCWVSTLRRSTTQGLVVVGLIFEELSNVKVNCVKVTAAWNTGQGHQVKVSAKSVYQEQALCKVCRPYSWGDIERRHKMCQSLEHKI